ncbi:MAG: hypothetical protein NC817_02025 [Candidatus Omnitrophica bacterium]|nr:hypothetical protein [Candidatus Omnitrophota bacterium]
MWEEIKQKIEIAFNFSLNKNQWRDIKRLIYEIAKRENLDYDTIIEELKDNHHINKAGGRNKFFVIKQQLINKRFPLTTKREKIDTKKVFLSDIKPPLPNLYQAKEFNPTHIFVEKDASDSYLLKRFQEKFAEVKIEELSFASEYIKKHKFSLEDLKKPIVFIVKERWDFIKPCPCTKNHLSCNYWILNLGFGCPFDCSYCFLQQYTNFPGIILPSNLNDFYDMFKDLLKKINSPIRIGTGEFCDSLALDEITNYSSQLINFLRDKPVLFELKTKSTKIDNLLKNEPSPNIIVSWSINPQEIIDKEELMTSSLEDRLTSAKIVQEKGYSLSFHFDPIIYSENWEKIYKETIETLFKKLTPPFRWISLGTLRGSRELKNIVEQRFPHSKIFYGELFLGEDKKLRYPKFLRKEIYQKMISWIRRYDTRTPVYLCMEDEEIWQVMDKKLTSSKNIESYIINNYDK